MLKVKRIASIVLVAAFAVAMLASCSVVNDNPVVLKVGSRTYTLSDYVELFEQELYTYVYNGGEAVENPEYMTQDSTERLVAFQDYVYEKLVDMAVKNYIVEEEKLAEKLTDEDKDAIEEKVNEQLEANASQYESDVTESSTTLEDMEKLYTLTEEEEKSIDETADKQIETEVAEKLAVKEDTSSSDDVEASDDTAKSDDTAASGETEDEEAEPMTKEEAQQAVAEEAGFDTFEDYVESVKEEVRFDLYFAYYKKDMAMKEYKKSFEKGETTYDETVEEIREEVTEEYLRDTTLPEFLAADYEVSDEEAEKYFNDKVAEYKENAEAEKANTYYKYLDDAMKNEKTVWYLADGYYYVKHILLKNEETDTKASDTAKSEDAKASDVAGSDAEGSDATESEKTANVSEDLIEEVEKAIAELEKETDETKKLEGFDALIEKYGEDPGMQNEPGKTMGYLMGAGHSMVEEFGDASEALYNDGEGKIGDISEGVVSDHGIHYIQLVKVLEPAEVKFADVKEEVIEEVTEANRETVIKEKIDTRKKDIDIKDHVDRIRSCGSQVADMYFGKQASTGTTTIGG
ncbi:MAG: hypothetical protein IJO93_02305 [Clostridia bacterium]|nr:hypothetical protein [Clostridia bacterium]